MTESIITLPKQQTLIVPHVEALIMANGGIDYMQAKTMVYYAYATYYVRFIDPFPILVIQQDFGCGKSDLMETLFQMCDGGKWIEGRTYATIRNELQNCPTAFFDEIEDLPENLLRQRFKRLNSKMKINQQIAAGFYQPVDINVFGATVVAKRHPFKDPALRSRCLIISPKYCPGGDYRVTNVGSLDDIIAKVGKPEELQGSGRTVQVWRPLESVSRLFKDEEWINWAKQEFNYDMVATENVRQFEPREAVMGALEICKSDKSELLHVSWVKLSSIRRVCESEFDQRLKPSQLAEMLTRDGREVKPIDGYPAVKL